MRIKHDPIEKTQEFKEAMEYVERRAFFHFFFKRKGMGFCHQYWAFKKRILKEKFDIDWKTPQELNPNVRFD